MLAMPRPNHIMKIGARITRGMALAALMNGSSTAMARRASPSQSPAAMPAMVPRAKAISVSAMVTARCGQMSPVTNQSRMTAKMASGRPKNSGGSTPVSVPTCQPASSAAAISSRPSRIMPPLPPVGAQHFVAQHGPDLAFQFLEMPGQADFGNVARARQIDGEFGDRARGGAGGQHHHAVGQADRLLQVMGDEQHRFAPGACRLALPEGEQFGFHHLPGLHVERAERLVHQQDRRVHDQHLGKLGALAHAAGHLVRVFVAVAGQADAGEPLAGQLARGPAGAAGEFGAGGDVVGCVAPGHEAVGLEQIAGAAVDAGKRRAEHAHAAGAGGEQAGGEVEQGGLAAAGGADNGQKLTGADR